MVNLFLHPWKIISNLSNILNLFIPCFCFICNRKTENNKVICSTCLDGLELYSANEDQGLVEQIDKTQPIYFDASYHLFKYNRQMKELIHLLKYSEIAKVVPLLFEIGQYKLEKFTFLKNIDLVIPVPLHTVKQRERGFNQAEIISVELCAKFGLICCTKCIVRTKYTQTQTTQKKEDRKSNVENIFGVKSKETIQNKHILIVDDVFTTGATVNSLAKVIKEYSPASITVFTLAHA